ncbi:hypothetical protein PPL_08490 [Heterostelium album PN500]|uniref:Ankyrin repeat-containing protein n=1 Tax=Heterostelium pallidum (strain ATCC 26659 / Pp 5 / PN500) TaxID=670386 RepID=D3BIC2_HETP5|nr:hypothetical protein PPL_08490 [Heterostelium album PN500]EFA79022.1 hypothetical protein PPL_08490 [Heterostelium album PN500]|eukprot:XP_020431145.1 hypothetical protein PPL_08490 [Heterostelium album PN500]
MKDKDKQNLFIKIFRIHFLRDKIFECIESIGQTDSTSIKGRHLIEQQSINLAIRYGITALFKSLINDNLKLFMEVSGIVQMAPPIIPQDISNTVNVDTNWFMTGFDQFIVSQLSFTIEKKQFAMTEFLLDRFPTLKIDCMPHSNLVESGNISMLFKYLDKYSAFYNGSRSLKFSMNRNLLDPAHFQLHLKGALESRNFEIVEYMNQCHMFGNLRNNNIECILLFCDLQLIKKIFPMNTTERYHIRSVYILAREQLDLEFFLYFHRYDNTIFQDNNKLLIHLLSNPNSKEIVEYIFSNTDQFVNKGFQWYILSIHPTLLTLGLLKTLMEPTNKVSKLVVFDYKSILGDAIACGRNDLIDYLFSIQGDLVYQQIEMNYQYALSCAIHYGREEAVDWLLTNHLSSIDSIPIPRESVDIDDHLYLSLYEKVGYSGLRMPYTVLISNKHHQNFRTVFKQLHSQKAIILSNEQNNNTFTNDKIVKNAMETGSLEWLYFILSLTAGYSVYGNFLSYGCTSIEMLDILMEHRAVTAESALHAFIYAKRYPMIRHIIENYPSPGPPPLYPIEGIMGCGNLEIFKLVLSKHRARLLEFFNKTYWNFAHPKLVPYLIENNLWKHLKYVDVLTRAITDNEPTVVRWLYNYFSTNNIELASVSKNSVQYTLENNIFEGIEYLFDPRYKLFTYNHQYTIQLLNESYRIGHIIPMTKLLNYLKQQQEQQQSQSQPHLQAIRQLSI